MAVEDPQKYKPRLPALLGTVFSLAGVAVSQPTDAKQHTPTTGPNISQSELVGFSVSNRTRDTLFLSPDEINHVDFVINEFKTGKLDSKTQRNMILDMYFFLNKIEHLPGEEKLQISTEPTTAWKDFYTKIFPFLSEELRVNN